MRKLLAFMTLALLLSPAVAAALPTDGEVEVTADGAIVGVGEFDDGNLELRLLEGFSGAATLTVEDTAGNLYSFDVVISSEGTVSLDSEDLQEVVEEEGKQAVITVEENLEVNGNMAFGAGVPDHVELPQVALDGMARAKANHDLARERATEAGVDAEAEVGDEGGAEASVNVGLALGKR